MNKGKSSEGQQQALLFNWAEWAKAKYPCLQYMHHIPNGGSRNKKEAANLKRQGVKPGVPDVCLPYPCGGYHGLYIEMKFGKNKPTKKQKEFLAHLDSVGYKTAVCYNWEDARSVILAYLEGLDKKRSITQNLKLWGDDAHPFIKDIFAELGILPYDEFKISDNKDAIYHITNDLQVQRKRDDGEFGISLISINCLLNHVYDIKIISRYKDKYPDEK